tara:strand:- start:26698 stop:26871 length:174 start_codon:yes stop_codon:yes gene_type:complete
MTKLEFADSETSINVTINQDRVSLQEAISTFTDFLTDAGYELGEGKTIGLIDIDQGE